MIRFTKGNDQNAPYFLDMTRYLNGEGDGVTLSSIVSATRLSGDVELGTGVYSPSIIKDGTFIKFWVSEGTAGTSSVFEFIFTTAPTGSTDDVQVVFDVTTSTN